MENKIDYYNGLISLNSINSIDVYYRNFFDQVFAPTTSFTIKQKAISLYIFWRKTTNTLKCQLNEVFFI